MTQTTEKSQIMSLQREQPHYFGAGPALLPSEVLQQAAQDLLRYNDENLGVGEISHRSKPAINIIDDTKANLTKLLNIPNTHEIFFLQGGGTSGFSSIAYNLFANYATTHNGNPGKAAYAVTGSWSKKAYEEAVRLGFAADVVVDTQSSKYGDIPAYSQWKPLDDDTTYLYLADNETVHGNEFKDTPPPDYLKHVELVADMSSNILSKPIDVSKYGLIMAGAQKNVGIAGLTIYIIKKTLITQASDQQLRSWQIPLPPIAFHYPTVIKNNSAYNTIPIFTCHILKLVTDKVLKEGGLDHIQQVNQRKAKILYDALDACKLYTLPVVNPQVRSTMNVVFTLPTEELEAQFIKEAGEHGLTGLKGHRSVGGIRASIYNAVSLESVECLVNFLQNFCKNTSYCSTDT